MADRKKVYMDSCCFIDLAKEAIGALLPNRKPDVWFTWKLLQAHKDREIDVITSVLTIAEATHADGNNDANVRDLLTRLLMSGQYLQLVQPTPFIAADARDLRWIHGCTLRGADGLHVASALFLKADEFLTTDDRITSHQTVLSGMNLQVLEAAKTTCLPDRYRQGEMLDEKVTVLRPKAIKGSA